MSTLTPAADQATQSRKPMLAAMMGSIVEWYDFALYGAAAALVFARLFFDPNAAEASAVWAFMTFAAGFLVRPLGGIIFGHYGDKLGRRPMLVITLILMGVSTTLIGLLPTREMIGPWAAGLLIILRCLQGLGAGAEYAGAILVASESSQAKKRGSAGAWPAAGSWIGSLLALGVMGAFSSLLSEEQFLSWGWRVPFIISIFIVAFGYWVRSSVPETVEFEKTRREQAQNNNKPAKAPIVEVLRDDWPRLLVAMGSTVIHTGYSYILQVFALRYMTAQIHLSSAQALTISSTAYAIGIIALPLWGKLCDRVGSRQVYLGGAIFSLLYIVPFFYLVNTGNVYLGALALTLGLAGGMGSQFAAQASFLTQLFPVHIRFSGIAFSREITSALIAGPAPAVATLLVSYDNGGWHYLAMEMAACAIITIIALLCAKKYLIKPEIQ